MFFQKRPRKWIKRFNITFQNWLQIGYIQAIFINLHGSVPAHLCNEEKNVECSMGPTLFILFIYK